MKSIQIQTLSNLREACDMPPTIIKSIRDLICWQYAKIIADSAGIGKTDYRFVMNKFKQLKMSNIARNEIREYISEKEHRI